jgi:hypothetical protein
MPDLESKTSPIARAAVLRRFDALFRAMSHDFLLREQFVTDPARIASEYVYGARLPPRRAAVINHLLYSIAANPHLAQWLHNYAIRHRFELPPPERLVRDFSHAVARHNGHDVVLSLIRASVENESAIDFENPATEVAFQIIGCGTIRPSTRTPFPAVTVPGTFPSTDPSTEQSGTHFSGTGTGTEPQTQQSTGTQPQTEQSTGTQPQTEQSTGTGTQDGTGTGTEQSTGTGTEQSTGTGTEQSTGTGTEQSTGTGTGDIRAQLPFGSYIQVTVDAVMQFAAQLRDSGALSAFEKV